MLLQLEDKVLQLFAHEKWLERRGLPRKGKYN